MADPRVICLDFETFYDRKAKYTLKHLSVPEFIHDPRFRVHGLAVEYGDRRGAVWYDAKDVPAALEEMQGDILVMHNAFFDAGVLAWHYKFSPAYMIDTLQLANHVFGSARDMHHDGNDLASLARRLGLDAKGNALELVDGVAEPDEAQIAALAAYAKQDVRLTRQVLDKLLPYVGNQDFELWLLDHTLRIYIDKMLDIDLDKIKEARKVIAKRRAEALEASGVSREVLNSNKQFAEELQLRMAKAKMKVPMKRAAPRKDGSTPLIPALAKNDPEFIKLQDAEAKPVADLVKGRLIERSAVTVAARLATMEMYHRLGLGIPVHLVYYGAHTGRFAGGGGFNFQNLTSPARATNDLDRLVASLVREAITPGEGRVFVPVDAAQIEARVEAWLAGEDQISDAFAAGEDIYSQFISEALGEDIHKPTGNEPPEQQHYLKLMRQAGKESILGLGYSMGKKKFRERLRKERDLWPLLEDGGKLSVEVTDSIVDAYREKYTKIVQFWEDLEKAFRLAILGKTTVVNDKLKFWRVERGVVGITLPSGRTLYYRNLKKAREKGKWGERWTWRHGNGQRVYGGLLAENVTQAVARDILAESILAAEQEGYPVVLHIHDEIVARVPESEGEKCLNFLIKTLSTPPEWGQGLVLAAEGHVAKNLAK